jgi:hypothetical protein
MLDHILSNLKKPLFDNNNMIFHAKTKEYYAKSYINKNIDLMSYEYINSINYNKKLTKGLVIKYTKSLETKPSCACIIKKIILNVNNDKIISGLILSTVWHNNSTWKINPDNYFIFIYNNELREKQFVQDKIKKIKENMKNMKIKEIKIDKKEISKIMKFDNRNK